MSNVFYFLALIVGLIIDAIWVAVYIAIGFGFLLFLEYAITNPRVFF